MNKLQKKAIGLIDSFPDNLFFDIDESDYRKIVDAVVIALKEQDMDTRHACAESILDIQPICETPSGADAFSIDDIEKAIMNCRGGIE